MEKLSDYFLLSRFKVLLVNFLSKTRKTFDGQRHAKVLFCYCIHSMKSTLLATVVHALFMSSPTDRVALCVCIVCIVCSMNCEFTELICVTRLSNDMLTN